MTKLYYLFTKVMYVIRMKIGIDKIYNEEDLRKLLVGH